MTETYQKMLSIIGIIIVSIILFKFISSILFSVIFFVVGMGMIMYFGNKTESYQSPNEPFNEELVVAVCNEDVSWIDNYAHKYRLVTVYNKCGHNINFKSHNVKVIDTPNIGMCDYAYLSYIISRYDTLPKYIEFTKGWVKPTGKYHHCEQCKKDNNAYNKYIKEFKLKKYNVQNKSNRQITKNLDYHQSEYNNMGEWIENQTFLNEDIYKRNMCNIIYGGHFGLTSEQVLRTPKNIWKQLILQQKYPQEEIDHFIERTWRPLLCRVKYTLVIVAIFKNEAIAMKEWLQHYINQGVEHFYMIDNGSTDNWESEVDGFPVTIFYNNKKHNQVDHYNNYFLKNVQSISEWVMVVDLDEFMYARNGFNNIPEYLNTIDENVDQISVFWKMFGSNGHITQPKSIIKGFTKRIFNKGQKTNCKSIIRTTSLVKLDIHKSQTYNKNGISVPFNKPSVTETIYEDELETNYLHLNHYAIQSYNWFKQVKMTRGSVTSKKNDNIRTDDYFKKYDWNDIEDIELSNIKYNITSNITSNISTQKFPKVIHKVFLDNNGTYNIDENTKKAHNSWKTLNNGYTLKLWNKKECREYLIKHFPRIVINTFDNLIPYAYKCDFFRYCVLYIEGGWYSDWNEVCLINNLLDKLCINNAQSIIYFTDKDGISLSKNSITSKKYIYCAMNGFFGSVPRNRILKNVIDQIILNVQNKYYGDNRLEPTGPVLFGKEIQKYFNTYSCGYYTNNYYYHNNFGKVIKHKIIDNKQNYKDGNNYTDLWNKKNIYNNIP